MDLGSYSRLNESIKYNILPSSLTVNPPIHPSSSIKPAFITAESC